MVSISKMKAEERLAAIQKSQKAALSEHEEETLKTRQNTARLRAQRLAKENADQKSPTPKKKRGTK